MNTSDGNTVQIAVQDPRSLVVAVTGHAHLGDPASIDFVARAFKRLLGRLQRQQNGPVVALSGLSAGADTLFAEAALACGWTLDVCIAATKVVENFPPGPERDQHLRLRAHSRRMIELPFARRSNGAYMAMGYWLVDTCDLLIAAWNGRPAAALGGTGDVVAYAQAEGRPIIHVHPLERTIMRL